MTIKPPTLLTDCTGRICAIRVGSRFVSISLSKTDLPVIEVIAGNGEALIVADGDGQAVKPAYIPSHPVQNRTVAIVPVRTGYRVLYYRDRVGLPPECLRFTVSIWDGAQGGHFEPVATNDNDDLGWKMMYYAAEDGASRAANTKPVWVKL